LNIRNNTVAIPKLKKTQINQHKLMITRSNSKEVQHYDWPHTLLLFVSSHTMMEKQATDLFLHLFHWQGLHQSLHWVYLLFRGANHNYIVNRSASSAPQVPTPFC
jgi:hypothetical protein